MSGNERDKGEKDGFNITRREINWGRGRERVKKEGERERKSVRKRERESLSVNDLCRGRRKQRRQKMNIFVKKKTILIVKLFHSKTQD